MIDRISLERVKTLHPKLREEGKKILEEVSALLTGNAVLRFAFTFRSFEEQAKIYNQGRTTPGKIVTKAKPGSSMHNYGLAIDIVLIINGKEASWDIGRDYDKDGVPDWSEVVSIFDKYGWEYGGRWRTFKDYPHFQKVFKYTWQSLLALKEAGKVDSEGYVLI